MDMYRFCPWAFFENSAIKHMSSSVRAVARRAVGQMGGRVDRRPDPNSDLIAETHEDVIL